MTRRAALVVAIALGLCAGAVLAPGLRAAALPGVVARVDTGGDAGSDRVRSLDHHLAPALAELSRRPLDVRARVASATGAPQRTDAASWVVLDAATDAPATPAGPAGVRLRGPPTISA